MDSPSDGLVDPTSSFVPAEAMELFSRIGSLVVAFAVALFFFLFLRKFVFYLTWRSFRDGPYVIGYHQWRPGNLAGPHFCNICESIVYGIRSYVVTCDICGMFAHAQCAATTMKQRNLNAESKSACKMAAIVTVPPSPLPVSPSSSSTTTTDNESMVHTTSQPHGRHHRQHQHHLWIKGNIDPMDTCSICGLFCGSILALSGLKCAWCHVRVHENCFQQAQTRRPTTNHHKHHLLRHCHFGRHANLILRPSAVVLKDVTPAYASTSQRALSTVRSAAQIAVSKMSNIRLRRLSAAVASQLEPIKAVETDTASTAPSSPCSSPRMGPQEQLQPHALDAPSPCGSVSFTLQPIPTPPVSTTTITTTSAEMLPFDILPPKEGTPLLVFINSRSGGQMGLHVLRQIRRWLNPIQIYDLSHQSPIAPLIQFKDIPRLRILVCGGDGTVGWVLGALDEIGATRQPPIAILPLGTGNDLARVLGWGSGFSATDVSDILAEVEAAHVSLLDRWRVDIDGKKRGVLNNYLGVGVDAQVALEFHEQRERSPGLFMSQFVNKLWYSQFGAKNFLVRTCAGLPDKIELECDGQRIALPEGTEGVILLNINSYGGGSTLWHEESDSESDSESDESESDDDELDDDVGELTDDEVASVAGTDDGSISDGEGLLMGRHRHRRSGGTGSGRLSRGSSGRGSSMLGASSPHDGLLDVVAVYGTLHLGQMQVGLSKAVRLCQAKSVSIRLKETVPIQIDGEPWLQAPSQVDIAFHQQAFMLSRTVQERDFVTRRVGEVLDWAETTGVISSSQRDVLLAEIACRVVDDDGTQGSSLRPSSLSSAATAWRRENNATILSSGSESS